ncbi:MAG: NTP transferase domain-containing protein [Candidatus Eisenbacteria bacterium]|nr:NTP transferase domain-containing protein [Candidatus Eisenbacteria bacterium]
MAGTLGVLVAGGRGARLGLRLPKALARVGGRTLLERALETLGGACDEIVVAAPAGLRLPVPPGARADDVAGIEGPLSGLVAGLAARPFARALVLGVDFPLMPAALLRSLADRLGDRAAVVPAPGGIPQPLAAAYAPRAAAALAERLAAGERAVTVAVLALDPLLLGEAELARLEGGVESFLNFNTPGDGTRAESRLAVRARTWDAA